MYVSLITIKVEKGPRIYRSLRKEAQSVKLAVIDIKEHCLTFLDVPTPSIKLYNSYIPHLLYPDYRTVL